MNDKLFYYKFIIAVMVAMLLYKNFYLKHRGCQTMHRISKKTIT